MRPRPTACGEPSETWTPRARRLPLPYSSVSPDRTGSETVGICEPDRNCPNLTSSTRCRTRTAWIPTDTVEQWLRSRSINTAFLDDVLAESSRYRRLGGTVGRWSSVVDKCVSLLALRSSPADAETLVAEIGEGHSITSTRNRLFEDPRVMRISRTAWALRSWGLEEYTGITDEIAQRINEWGGRAKLTDLVEELVHQFGVSPGSVRVYAEAPMFVLEGGYVRMRRDGDLHAFDVDVAGCRGLFLNGPDRVSFRIVVDSELQRGSGRPCPEPVAAILGVFPDSSRLFAHRGGTLKVSWPMTAAMGPAFGSMRTLALDVGAEEGDSLRLSFNLVGQTCEAFCVPPAALAAMSVPEVMEALTGITDFTEGVRQTLARAIGVEPASLVPTLRRRGEDELLALLPPEEPDDALKDALAGLADLLED